MPPNLKSCIEIRAPVPGRVLKITQESEAVVQAGAPLIDIGNPLDLEVIADLLSTDAARIKPGSLVRIDQRDLRPELRIPWPRDAWSTDIDRRAGSLAVPCCVDDGARGDGDDSAVVAVGDRAETA